jgi:hypothetical protein
MKKKEYEKLLPFIISEKKARKFGTGAAKPNWSSAPKGYVKMESAGQFESKRRRH